jgi:hypothetical protein
VLSIVVCRGSYRPLSEVFPRQKHFI